MSYPLSKRTRERGRGGRGREERKKRSRENERRRERKNSREWRDVSDRDREQLRSSGQSIDEPNHNRTPRQAAIILVKWLFEPK